MNLMVIFCVNSHVISIENSVLKNNNNLIKTDTGEVYLFPQMNCRATTLDDKFNATRSLCIN